MELSLLIILQPEELVREHFILDAEVGLKTRGFDPGLNDVRVIELLKRHFSHDFVAVDTTNFEDLCLSLLIILHD
jgi:hypothetical protein